MGWLGAACFQLDEPRFELAGCPAVGVGGYHHGGYTEGDCCLFCGAVPFWPLWPCGNEWLADIAAEARAEHLCTGWEVFATATYDGRATLGLCWVEGER